jgi:4-aminobutyrate aminotransferase
METLNLPGPKAKLLIERSNAVISPSYARVYPFVMDHGLGSYVWDVDGNQFLDFAAGIAVNSTGHAHPRVVQAIKDQADKFLHISADFYHESWIKLGEVLDNSAPFKEDAVSFMTNSGTESVEAAIKLSRYHTGASQFIGFLGAFHGRTLGSLAFTASKPHYREGFYPLLNGVVHVPYPNAYRPLLHSRPGEDYGEVVVRYIDEQVLSQVLPHQDVAAILVETIQGEGGYIVPTPGFFPALRELCDRYDILLIVDEVQSGMGRTGKLWAIEHFGIEPDIICAGKGIASGIPLGAIIARKSIATWPQGSHGNTYGGNPIACVAALETLDLIQNGYMQNAVEVGSFALDALHEIQVRHPSMGEVRGMGLMIGSEFVMDRETKEPAHDLAERIAHEAFRRGLLTLTCGKSSIRISPPLSISKQEIEEGLEIFEEAITIGEKAFNL